MQMFKVGDKVRRISDPFNVQKVDTQFVVQGVRDTTIQDSKGHWWHAAYFVLAVDTSNHHKWHDIICAWAKGAAIQFRLKDSDGLWHEWVDVKNPAWFGYGYEIEYRVKPEPKPDVVYKKYVYESGIKKLCQCDGAGANVEYTFDGETGELKAVELIK
jgi:hypothetical protein